VRLGRADEALALLNATPAAAAGGAIAVARMSALLALSRSDEALAAGRQVATDDGVALPCAVTASALAAGAAEAEGDRGEAQRLAEHALDLAEPDGARLGLAVALDGLDPVLRRLLRVGTAHRSLIGEVLELARAGSTVTANGIAPLHEPLSERELTVLRYLPTLLSSSEIADELFVTVNTVKSHLKSIYRKLEVSSRREAVARARDLGLIASAGLSVAGRPG
jgi:LuxR family maltose regulon positive regulatory protein